MSLSVFDSAASCGGAVHYHALYSGLTCENRLYQRPDGSFEVLPKSPAEVVGERVIRPLIDATYSLSVRTFQLIKSGFSFLDTALTKTLQFLPVASASSVLYAPSENTKVSLDSPCPSLQALSNAQAKARQNHRGKDAAAIKTKTAFLTAEEARAYLEERIGPVATPQTYCQVENLFKLLKELKVPTMVQKKELERAYDELQLLVDQDALLHCEQRVIEMLTEFNVHIHQYSLFALEPLPKLLSSLLNGSGMDYTFADLDFLVIKINQLAREVVPKYQMTNNNKALHQWVDIILESAEKNMGNKDPLLLSFKTMIKLLQTSSTAKISKEQKGKLRKMAKLYQMSAPSGQDLAVASDVLKSTGSKIWVLDMLNSYIESLPDDIANLEESLKDVGSSLYQSTRVQLTSALPVLLLLLLAPDRAKKVLILVAALLAIRYCYSKYADL